MNHEILFSSTRHSFDIISKMFLDFFWDASAFQRWRTSLPWWANYLPPSRGSHIREFTKHQCQVAPPSWTLRQIAFVLSGSSGSLDSHQWGVVPLRNCRKKLHDWSGRQSRHSASGRSQSARVPFTTPTNRSRSRNQRRLIRSNQR